METLLWLLKGCEREWSSNVCMYSCTYASPVQRATPCMSVQGHYTHTNCLFTAACLLCFPHSQELAFPKHHQDYFHADSEDINNMGATKHIKRCCVVPAPVQTYTCRSGTLRQHWARFNKPNPATFGCEHMRLCNSESSATWQSCIFPLLMDWMLSTGG